MNLAQSVAWLICETSAESPCEWGSSGTESRLHVPRASARLAARIGHERTSCTSYTTPPPCPVSLIEESYRAAITACGNELGFDLSQERAIRWDLRITRVGTNSRSSPHRRENDSVLKS